MKVSFPWSGNLKFSVGPRGVGFRRIDKEVVFQGFASKKHAASHVFAVHQAQFDGFGNAAYFNVGGDNVTFVLLPVAGANVGLMGYGRHNGLGKISILSVENDIKLNPIPR